MFKAMILLKRREGMSMEEFLKWWLGQHAELAKQLPGLRRLCFNAVAGDGEGLYDGVSELWFDSEADFGGAYQTAIQTAIGQAVAADSLANVSKRERLLVQENVVVS